MQVVSNNNSAIDNVLQKMSSSEYNLGFLVALLGKNSNKNAFIENQTAKYPDMSTWKLENNEAIREKINENEMLLSDIFKKQQNLAKLKQELKDVKLESRYFDDYCNKIGNTGYKENFKHFRHPISSERLMQLWQKLDDITQRWDNACIESFHSLIKRKWLNRFKIRNYNHAYQLVFEYIEAFYNTTRIHSHCNYMSPDDFEKLYAKTLYRNTLFAS